MSGMQGNWKESMIGMYKYTAQCYWQVPDLPSTWFVKDTISYILIYLFLIILEHHYISWFS